MEPGYIHDKEFYGEEDIFDEGISLPRDDFEASAPRTFMDRVFGF